MSVIKSTFYHPGNTKVSPKTTADYLLINDYAFSNAIYIFTKKHATIEESTNFFSNSMLFLNKRKNSTTVEDIAEAFIYIDKSIKNLNRNVNPIDTPIPLVTFIIQ